MNYSRIQKSLYKKTIDINDAKLYMNGLNMFKPNITR
jgi:hypothetical protein